MPTNVSRKSAHKKALSTTTEKSIRVRMRALEIPPIKDGLIIGRDAAIGAEAMLRTLRLMTNEKFERVPMKDDVVHDVIVRTSVIRKLGHERLIQFVRDRVKPLMSETELLMLDIEIELVIDEGTAL